MVYEIKINESIYTLVYFGLFSICINLKMSNLFLDIDETT